MDKEQQNNKLHLFSVTGVVAVCIILFIPTISAEKLAVVKGKITSEKGEPNSLLELLLYSQNGTVMNSTDIESNDTYRFSKVHPGSYTLKVMSNNNTLYIFNFSLTPAEILTHNITIKEIPYGDDDDDNNGGPVHEPNDDDDDGDGTSNDNGIGPNTDNEISKEEENVRNLSVIFLVVILILLIISLAIFSRIRRSQLLKHDTRQRICSHIQENPGKHFTALKNELSLPTGVMSYHLDRLEKENFILSRMEGKFKRFYPPHWEQAPELRLTPIQETILEQIKKNPGISQSDITRMIGRNRKVVNYQVHQLEDMDLIAIEKDGRESMCYFVRNI